MTKQERKNIKIHLKTVRLHRKYVRQMCFKMGIMWRGIMHDLSKYSKEEMQVAKYANGKRSPHDIARDELGYSPSWCYHKNKNLHHWEAWLDFNSAELQKDGTYIIRPTPIKMPYDYIIECFCDFVGASMAYLGEAWTCSSPYEYWCDKCEGKRCMHPDSQRLLKRLLFALKSEKDLDNFVKFYKNMKKFFKESYESEV